MYRLAVTVPAEDAADYHDKMSIVTCKQSPSTDEIQELANLEGVTVELYFVEAGSLYCTRDSIFIPKDARPILCIQPNT